MKQPTIQELLDRIDSLQFSIQQEIINRSDLKRSINHLQNQVVELQEQNAFQSIRITQLIANNNLLMTEYNELMDFAQHACPLDGIVVAKNAKNNH